MSFTGLTSVASWDSKVSIGYVLRVLFAYCFMFTVNSDLLFLCTILYYMVGRSANLDATLVLIDLNPGLILEQKIDPNCTSFPLINPLL